jgi:peptidoglycan-associated lipoprotein
VPRSGRLALNLNWTPRELDVTCSTQREVPMRKTFSAASVLLALGMASGSSSADEPKSGDTKTDDKVKTGNHVAEANIYFEFDSDQLSAEARAELDQAATWIKSKKTGLILVEGHTDKVGGAPYNKDLGERRGEVAKAYLVSKGVPADRIRVLSYGEGLPAQDTDECRRSRSSSKRPRWSRSRSRARRRPSTSIASAPSRSSASSSWPASA